MRLKRGPWLSWKEDSVPQMKEIDQILKLWEKTEEAGESAVLATVVKTSGSSYRLPGARLILTKAGQRAGSISGGCLEEDLLKKAWWLTENGATIRRYDTTPDGEIDFGFGLGCNGIVHVLVERLIPDASNVLSLISKVRSARRPAAIAHVVSPKQAAGQYMQIDCAGSIENTLVDTSDAGLLEEQIRTALGEGNSRLVQTGGREFFLETLAPAVRLLIFGAGDDAVPLSEMAKAIGWQVFVIDGRSHYARREKFPAADVVEARNAQEPVERFIDQWTAAVLMTHSYSQDLDLLRLLIADPPRYLGMLGPRIRSLQLLAEAGIDPDKLTDSLYSPMGLDIGADGPEQVAISVIAEIQAALNGRGGGHLRERHGSIHAREDINNSSLPSRVPSFVCV